MEIGASEAETFCTAFLRKLTRRSLGGVKLVVSDSHEGIKAAVTNVLRTIGSAVASTHEECARPCGKQGRRVISVFIATVFAQNDA